MVSGWSYVTAGRSMVTAVSKLTSPVSLSNSACKASVVSSAVSSQLYDWTGCSPHSTTCRRVIWSPFFIYSVQIMSL